jgi:hypothetical protein
VGGSAARGGGRLRSTNLSSGARFTREFPDQGLIRVGTPHNGAWGAVLPQSELTLTPPRGDPERPHVEHGS